MRTIVQYIRSLFCKHEFVFSEKFKEVSIAGEPEISGTRISMLCKKCGYHKSFWKY